MELDPTVFGHRLRHFRQRRGLTLDQLGSAIGRPAPFLSLLENGKREAKLSVITALARALDIAPADLMAPEAPNHRAGLEIRLDRAQQHPAYAQLGLPHLRPSGRINDEVLTHLLALFDELARRDSQPVEDEAGIRQANAQVNDWLRVRHGYLDRIEGIARSLLEQVGYGGSGPLTSRTITDIAQRFGFTLRPVEEMPPRVRSVVDAGRKVIYIAQRNELRTRQARKAILQTVGAAALDHHQPSSALDLLTQRLQTAYFAAAVLVPEQAAVPALRAAIQDRDLAVGDLKEQFYVSYEMAAQRFTNLATRHFGIESHFLRTSPDGVVWKATVLDGLPLATDSFGNHDGRRLCRLFGARAAFRSEERFGTHHQFTDTPGGSYWCATHVSADQDGHSFTTGVRYEDAKVFRGRRTSAQVTSSCPDPACCRSADLANVVVHRRMQQRIIETLTPPLGDPDEIAELIAEQRSRTEPSLDGPGPIS